jgi:hypothetical protein
LDFPHKNNVALNAHWDDDDSSAGATGERIIDDVIRMKQASIDDRFYGPWVLYIPTNFETAIDKDFKSYSDKTIRQRILEIDGIQDIRVADSITADNVVLVQMTSDVVRLVQGMPISVVEWQTEGGMRTHFKVMTIMVPQIRADQNNRAGLIHGTK